MAESNGFRGGSLLIALVLLAAVGILVGTRQAPIKEKTSEPAASQQTIQTTVVKTIAYEGQDGKTVYELLTATHQVESQQSEAGVFVTKIDETGGDPDTFWIYYVNGEQGAMSSDKVVTTNGQKIEWRYEKF